MTEDADIERRGTNPPTGRDVACGGGSSDRTAPDPDVLGLVTDVERMLGRLRHEIDDSGAAERARTALEDERARLLERQIALESEVASLRSAQAARDEARVRELLAPRVEQLAEVARFLKTRRERLAALHRGLRLRARSQRVLRQIYADAIDPKVDAPSMAGRRSAGIAADLASAEAERDARILALDEPADADERAVFDEAPPSPRRGGLDLAARAAVVAAGLALVATASWFIAGAIVPERVVGTVEIEVAHRDPAPASSAGSPRAPSREIDAAPIASWIRSRLADATFAGAVAGRLADRGKSDAEAGQLVDDLAARASIDVVDDRLAIALPGAGAEPTAALLDAVATTAVFEANRDPARRTDGLRLEVANARREVGRTVFAHVEPVVDEGRPLRAGIVAGILLALAGLATAGLRALARRDAADATDAFARA